MTRIGQKKRSAEDNGKSGSSSTGRAKTRSSAASGSSSTPSSSTSQSQRRGQSQGKAKVKAGSSKNVVADAKRAARTAASKGRDEQKRTDVDRLASRGNLTAVEAKQNKPPKLPTPSSQHQSRKQVNESLADTFESMMKG